MNMQSRLPTGLQTRRNRGFLQPSFPLFEKPKPIGYFSSDTQQIYHPTDEQLRYFRAPSEYPLDLNVGIKKAIRDTEEVKDERLDYLFRFIIDHRDRVMSPNSQIKKLIFEFASSRGLLRLLMCTPYENKEDWCIQIVRYRGTCYMVQKETEGHREKRLKEPWWQTKMFSWGYKFEQYCLTKNPFEKPNTKEPVDECAKFFAVFHGTVQNIPFIFTAEMDGLMAENPVLLKDDPKQLENLKFVELKTRQEFNCHGGQNISYKTYKTRNMWCQSFLTGIEEIIVGLRDKHGLVHRIERIPVSSLPEQGENYWSPHICGNFLVEFLTYVRNLMQNVDCPYTVYDFYCDARSGTISYHCMKSNTGNSILPDWYLKIFE